MKRKNKLLIALLSATCLTAGAFGFAACNNSNETTDGITAVYNQYVSDTQAAGGTALSYEEWLKSVLSIGGKGEDGTDGKNGNDGKSAYALAVAGGFDGTEAEWLASLVGQAGVTPHIGENGNWYLGESDTGVKAEGADGVSIENVAMSTDGKKLLITLSGVETPVEVALPDSMTHVHTQSNEYKILIAPTPESEGLGYNECTAGDGHIELVVIPNYSYKFSVVLTGRNDSSPFIPFEGATVTLKDGDEVVATGTTDANGDVYFNDIEKKAYTYEVTADGYNVVYGGEDPYTEPETDEYNTDYFAILVKAVESGDGSEESPYVVSHEISEEGDIAYAYLVPAKEKRHGYNLNTDVYFTFTAPKSGLYRTMEQMYNLEIDSTVNTCQGGALFLNEGEQAVITLKSDDTLYDFLVVAICFEEELTPGTMMLPMNFEADKEFTITADDADEGGYVYLKFTSAKNTYIFTSSVEGVEIKYNDGMDEVELGKAVSNIGVGEFSWDSVTAFQVKLPEGADSATLKVVVAPGVDADHAIELAFDTATKPELRDGWNPNYSAWYKYVVTAENAGLKTFEFGEENFGEDVYSELYFAIYDNPPQSDSDIALAAGSGNYPYMFKEGIYYIQAKVASIWDNTVGDYGDNVPGSFKIRDYNEETDKGLSQYAYLTVTLGEATDPAYRYYKYTATEEGSYIVDGGCSVYSDEEFKTEITVKNGMIELAAEQSVYFEMSMDYTNYPNYFALTLTKVSEEILTTPVKYTITVVDNNFDGIEGVTVTVNGKTDTTDENGVVELSIVPGEYEVELDFGDNADTYVYEDKATTEKLFVDSEISISVATKRDVSVEVTDLVTMNGIEGIEVTVWTQVQGDRGDETEEIWEQVGEAQTTDENGVAAFTLLSGKNYIYKLANVPEKYKVAEYYTINNIQLKEKSETPENPENPDDPTPEVEETYLYKGWKDEFEGEQSYKLYTGTMYEENVISIRVSVQNGYIKNLTAINVETELEAKAVIDGQLQEDPNYDPDWDPAPGWNNLTGSEQVYELIINVEMAPITFAGSAGIKLELEVVSYGDMPAQVIIEKVSNKTNTNF